MSPYKSKGRAVARPFFSRISRADQKASNCSVMRLVVVAIMASGLIVVSACCLASAVGIFDQAEIAKAAAQAKRSMKRIGVSFRWRCPRTTVTIRTIAAWLTAAVSAITKQLIFPAAGAHEP